MWLLLLYPIGLIVIVFILKQNLNKYKWHIKYKLGAACILFILEILYFNKNKNKYKLHI